jgi:colicin import membrane protein
MSTLVFGERPQRGYGGSFALAFAVHAVLIAVMFLGVRWQSHAPQTVSVELWEPAPPAPAPVVEAPKPPPPRVEPDPPKPEPKIEKPQIVEKPDIKPKPKPKPEVKPEVKPKAAEVKPKPPARDLDLERRVREELAREQAAAASVAQERQMKELLARQQASARDKALNEYISRIQAKVKSNWILPAELTGNPEAVFSVVQLPNGEVIQVRISKSSGNPAYDTAVERAILKSSPLPLPSSRELFSRELRLTFRPQDK